MQSLTHFVERGLQSVIRKWRGISLITPAIASLVILLRLSGLLQFWEWQAFDLYMRYQFATPQEQRIVIVGITEADLQTVGQALVPDGVYAELLQKLSAMQPRAIGLDVYRDLPVPPGHSEFIQMLQTLPNIVGIQKVVGDQQNDAIAPQPVLRARGLVGASDLILDADHRVRRGLLYLNGDDGQTVFSFSLVLALLYLEADGIIPQTVEGTNHWQLGRQVFTPLEPNDGGYVRADTQGYQLLVNYQGGKDSFEIVSLTDILQDRVPQEWGRDRIILIGSVGESFSDSFVIPRSKRGLTFPEAIPGVKVQAYHTRNIIRAAQGESPLFQTWSNQQEYFWIFLWSGIGTTIAWTWRYSQGKIFLRPQVRWLLFSTVVLIGSTYLSYLRGWWIPVIPPLLGLLSSAAVITSYMAQTVSSVREKFGRYLDPELVSKIFESQDSLKLGGQKRCITILSADLRGFTPITEQLSPEDVVQTLNTYFQKMSQVISHYEGTINKFMGDGILVIFGLPTSQTDHAQRAVACALAMQLEMRSFNQNIREWCPSNLEIGIGINTGEAIVGNIGSEEHLEYTAIGREVNLAFRIEHEATGNQIWISEFTQEAVDLLELKIKNHKELKIKAAKKPLKIYEIAGIGQPYNLFLPEEDILLSLPVAIPICYWIEGTQGFDCFFEGSLVKLSPQCAEIQLDPMKVSILPPYKSEIKINFIKIDNPAILSEEIYAKVLENTSKHRSFQIRFTLKSAAVSDYFETLYESLKQNRQ